LRLGTQLVAGLGVATVIPDLDFETYSEAGYVWDDAAGRWTGPPGAPGSTKGLPLTGTEPYVKHPSFDIVWMAYDLKDGGGRRRWHPGMPPPMDLFGYVLMGGPIEAWNVGFERWVWLHHCVARLGWPPVRDDQWRCAMAKARASGYPGALGKAGAVLGLQTQKDPRGSTLMKKFSMPRNPTKTDPRRRVMPSYTHPGYPEGARKPIRDRIDADYEDTLAYGAYNETDIASEAEASSLIPDLTGEELLWWQTHERINQRGVHIDRAGVENCIAVVEQAFAKYNGELVEITGIDAASKVQQLLGWLHSRNVHLDSLDEESVDAALAWTWLPPDARRVLEIRAAIGSAAVKKLFAIRNRLSDDDRLRDLYVYHGARTGRSTGEGPQPTNVAKAGPDTIKCGCGKHYGTHVHACPFCGMPRAPDARVHEWSPEIAEQALDVIATRSLAWVERVYGDALHAIAGCLRALFDAAPGHDLIGTDYNSIEAVGLAMLAGEQWRIEVFETHGKIYEKSASMMYKVPFEEFAKHKAETGQHHPLRQKGKIGELAFGYQGWLGAAKAFNMPGTDDEIKDDILAWRAASPAIEFFWGGQTKGKENSIRRTGDRWDRTEHYFGVEGMAIQAVLQPGQWHDVLRMDGTHSGVSFQCRANKLYCRLPSDRILTYHDIELETSDRGGWALSFYGWNTNPKNGPVGWIRMNTWGGRLVENINQAICRDILRRACIVLEAAGYPVVLHVYDEIVAEVPEGVGTVEQFEHLVTEVVRRLLAWAATWPIRAPGGFRAKRYGKR
jgi:DNA polymerase